MNIDEIDYRGVGNNTDRPPPSPWGGRGHDCMG